MTTYKTSHPYSERAQHSRLRSTHEHKHQAPAAPRANLDNTREACSTTSEHFRKVGSSLAVSVSPAHEVAHQKSMLQRPDQKKLRICRAASRASAGARAGRQTQPTHPGAARSTRLRLQQRRAPEVPQYASTDVVSNKPRVFDMGTDIAKPEAPSCRAGSEGEERYPIGKSDPNCGTIIGVTMVYKRRSVPRLPAL